MVYLYVILQQGHQPAIDFELELLVVEVRHFPDMTLADRQFFRQTLISLFGG